MLQERLEKLFERRRFGMRPGLERIQALLDALGNPERAFVAVHVAGTNGKGSVATLVASALDAAGFGTGRFTSPHLRTFHERIVLRGQPISDAGLESALDRVETAASTLPRDLGEPTFFEMATAAAFEAFRAAGIRLAVVETGLGGRLDATNVLVPLVSVITQIGLEHCDILGDTLAAIAREKGGIIKPGRPVVAGAIEEEALGVLSALARERGAPFIDSSAAAAEILASDLDGLAVRLSSTQRDLGKVRLGLAGTYQAQNAATALATLETLSSELGLEIPDAAIRDGFAAARWPGRFDLVRTHPPVLVDGAHNPQAILALRQSLKATRFKGPVALVTGFCADKDAGGAARLLSSFTKRAWAVPVPSPRSLPPGETAVLLRAAGVETHRCELPEALAEAESWAEENHGLVLVCGSLFLAGQALSLLQGDGAPPDPSELLRPLP
ncbi:MAG: bifunctional folylpolyglutamate synthase/dihydrofolate synthase [Kiritimatiellia bacterium]